MPSAKRLIDEIAYIKDADKMQLNYPAHPIKAGMVNLHYYHAEWLPGANPLNCNLGDFLSPVIVRWMLEQKGIDSEKKVAQTRHLYAIGSILQMGYQNAAVWGTGFAFEPSRTRSVMHTAKHRKLDIRCVRGPRTRETLLKLGHSCPEVYGDPCALMPLIYKPKEAEKSDYLIIPQYSVERAAREKYGDEHILSMNTSDYASVIDRIAAAEKVVTSSLHGLILAEIYGIPAVFFRDRDPRFDYKYEDWYLSTGRTLKAEVTASAALKKEPEMPPAGSIEKLREMLLSSFPYDLWE